MGWKDIRQKLKDNEGIHRIVVRIKRIYFFHAKKAGQELQGVLRKIFPSRYKGLKKYQNLYKGKRCFIVCTGPSLSFEDLSLIRNEYSFGMNSIIRIFDKTDWRPSFYAIQDKHVYEKMEDEITKIEVQDVFVSDEIEACGYPLPDGANIFPLNFYGHEYFNFDNPAFKFSDDIVSNVYDGFSVTYSILQIAYYMGFSEVYLLGCDCSYAKEPEKQHFVSSGHIDPNAHLVGGLQSRAYSEAKRFCETHKNFKIYNATRGGYLEIFNRVNLDEVVRVDK